MIWQSLLLRERSAEYWSWQTAARMPGILLAVMHMPMPVPHSRMPRSWRPAATAEATSAALSGYRDGLVSWTP